MREVPKNLSELVFRYEQMKFNLIRNRQNVEVRDYVGIAFMDCLPLFERYGDKKAGAAYLTWYVEYINDRLPNA